MAKKTLNFGPLTIEYDSPVRTPFGVPVDDDLIDREFCVVPLCPITYRLAGYGEFTVPADEISDEASTPRLAWSIRGFAPGGRKIWGAVGHDHLCVLANRGEVDRVIADAWFDAILEHTGVGAEQRTVMEIVVNAYRWLCRYLKWKAGK